jgi:glutamate/tyrosine decarboxylase-like PLP-dependent enzyme
MRHLAPCLKFQVIPRCTPNTVQTQAIVLSIEKSQKARRIIAQYASTVYIKIAGRLAVIQRTMATSQGITSPIILEKISITFFVFISAVV